MRLRVPTVWPPGAPHRRLRCAGADCSRNASSAYSHRVWQSSGVSDPVDGTAPDPAVLSDAGRLAAVRRLLARGRPPAGLADLTALAARLLSAESAQVSLLGEDEQVVAALTGPHAADAPRTGPLQESLCTVTVASGAPLVIPDARSHRWVADLAPVRSGAVGAYLGVVITDDDGHALGSLCVFDSVARPWSPDDVQQLEAVADTVATALSRLMRDDRKDTVRAHAELASEAAGLGSFDYDPTSGRIHWDDRMLGLHGLSGAEFRGTMAAAEATVHPDDRQRVQQALSEVLRTIGDVTLDYRVADGEGLRWIQLRGCVLPDMAGRPGRFVGVAYDLAGGPGLRDELTRLLERMPAAFLRCDHDWTITYVNSVAEGFYRRTRYELLGRNLWEAFPQTMGSTFESTYRQAMRTGEPAVVEGFSEPLDAHFEVHVWPEGPGRGLVLFFRDVSERTITQLAMERANDRLAVLSSAGARLAASLQPREVLEVLADLVVPALASSLVLAVTDPVAALLGVSTGNDSTAVHAVHVRHADPEAQTLLREVVGRLDLRTTASTGVGRAVRTGEVELSGPTLTIPLRSPKAVLGVMSVTAGDDRPPDELLLGDLARRAAAALDNALVFARQNQAATVLQRALLPRTVPMLPDVLVATRYLPANEHSLAGGDFFKTVRVEGRMVCVLGDVMGHGTASAARAGQLHGIVASLALEGHGPGELLARLASGIEQTMDLQFATVLVCSYDTASRTLVSATAGHPPPLIAPPSGEPYFQEVEPGPPLGAAAATYPETADQLSPGATLVLFSDGLVERRGEDIGQGLERLRRAVTELRLPPEAVAEHVLHAVATDAGDDDIALLVLSHL